MVHFGEFLKTWILLSNSVTWQVNFNRTKIGGKCHNLINSNATFWVIFKKSKVRKIKKNAKNAKKCEKLETFGKIEKFKKMNCQKLEKNWKVTTIRKNRKIWKIQKFEHDFKLKLTFHFSVELEFLRKSMMKQNLKYRIQIFF